VVVARKKKEKDILLARFLAKEALVAGKPKRTLGHLFAVYRATKEVYEQAQKALDEVLETIFRGETGPPDTGPWSSWPRYRRLYFTMPDGRVHMMDFGWSHKTNHVGGGFWVRTWSESRYNSLRDDQCVLAILGRRPVGAMDELAAEMEIASALSDNDPVLAERFMDAYVRANHTLNRVRVVERKIADTVTRFLGETQDWTSGGMEAWRRVTLDDGTILTVTNQGRVIHGDALIEVKMSMQQPAVVKEAAFPYNLAERQRKAREAK
jgi:hypothetical protein